MALFIDGRLHFFGIVFPSWVRPEEMLLRNSFQGMYLDCF